MDRAGFKILVVFLIVGSIIFIAGWFTHERYTIWKITTPQPEIKRVVEEVEVPIEVIPSSCTEVIERAHEVIRKLLPVAAASTRLIMALDQDRAHPRHLIRLENALGRADIGEPDSYFDALAKCRRAGEI